MDEQLGLGFNPQGECSGTAFNFIHSASPLVGEVFHYRPRLIQGETIFRLKNFILGEAEIELTPSSVYETLTILYRKTAPRTSFRKHPNQDTFEILGSSLEQIGSTTYGDNKRGGVVCG